MTMGSFKSRVVFVSAMACIVFTCASASAGTERAGVPGDKPFTDTGITLIAGAPLRIDASGKIEITPWSYWGRDGYDWRVGPLGTYDFQKSFDYEQFPLASAQRGPAACYCLIGKIGADGKPFFVGEHYYNASTEPGRLFLGVNDFNCADNSGEFIAEIRTGDDASAPEEPRDEVVYSEADLPEGEPVPDANVVLIYVDSLRYDVLREMAQKGYLPVIKEHFFDNGTDFINAFTGFPSSTLASNSTMYTGVFTNRSGIKGNDYFDRKKLKGNTHLEPFGPTKSADAQRPAGLHRLAVILKKGALRLFPSAYTRYLKKRKDDILLLEDYLERQGMEYYTTVQPIHPENPPNRYELDGCNVIPPFYCHHAEEYVDQIQSRYGHDLVIQPDARVMNFWFPNVDLGGHNSARAQFGKARKDIFLLDRWVGKIVKELKRKKMWDRTYMLLFADHGVMGGKSIVLQQVDIGRELFHRPVVDANGDGEPDPGSGMDWNVRWYDDYYTRKGRKKKSFVFLDHADGACRVYLPYAGIDSGDWLRRNGLYNLTHYRGGPGYGEVDLIQRILAWNVNGGNLYPEEVSGHPVAQILVKVGGNRLAVFGQEGRSAIIEREKTEGDGYLYRYIPAEGIRCSPDSSVEWNESYSTDPFGYLEAGIPFPWLSSLHGEREWLEKTKCLSYPDAVVGVATQMFWDGMMAYRELRESPDMILCANRGWAFESPKEPAGAHGYLHYESTRIPLLITGPNVREGIVISDAVRTADFVPTVLYLLGVPCDERSLDGKRIRGFLKRPEEKAWRASGKSVRALLAKLPYSAEEVDRSDILAEYERRKDEKQPEFLVPDNRYQGHDIERATDLHIVGADVFSVFNWEVFTILDTLFDLAYPGDKKRPFNTAFDKMIAGYDTLPDYYPKERVRELIFALQIREVSSGEVPSVLLLSIGGLTGRGVFLRAILLIKWLEHICSDLDHALLYPLRDKNIKLVSNVNYPLSALRFSIQKLSWGTAYYLCDVLWEAVYHVEKGNEKIVRSVKRQGQT